MGESIVIDGVGEVIVLEIRGRNKAVLAIDIPKKFRVTRKEATEPTKELRYEPMRKPSPHRDPHRPDR